MKNDNNFFLIAFTSYDNDTLFSGSELLKDTKKFDNIAV